MGIVKGGLLTILLFTCGCKKTTQESDNSFPIIAEETQSEWVVFLSRSSSGLDEMQG